LQLKNEALTTALTRGGYSQSAFDITILALITSIVAYYGISSIIVAFECIPRRRIWDKSVPGRCINTPWAINFRGAFNIFTDIVILLLPIHAICKLQLDRTKKFKCVMAFTLGAWYVVL
jgi:hypothetical protein